MWSSSDTIIFETMQMEDKRQIDTCLMAYSPMSEVSDRSKLSRADRDL